MATRANVETIKYQNKLALFYYYYYRNYSPKLTNTWYVKKNVDAAYFVQIRMGFVNGYAF